MEQLRATMIVAIMGLIIVSCFSLANIPILIVFGLIALVVFKMLVTHKVDRDDNDENNLYDNINGVYKGATYETIFSFNYRF